MIFFELKAAAFNHLGQFERFTTNYSFLFSSSANKFLKKAEKQLAKRIINRIEKLAEDPFPL